MNALDFFVYPYLSPIADVWSKSNEAQTSVFDAPGLLLLGPPKCGKTSLAFQHAANAARDGLSVLFICQKARMTRHPPLFRHSEVPPSPSIPSVSVAPAVAPPPPPPHSSSLTMTEIPTYLERVSIHYIDTEKQLRELLACCHLMNPLPHLIVLDDCSSFTTEYNRSTVQARNISFVADTCAFLSQLHQQRLKKDSEGDAEQPVDADADEEGVFCRFIITDSPSRHGMSFLPGWVPALAIILPLNAKTLTVSPLSDMMKKEEEKEEKQHGEEDDKEVEASGADMSEETPKKKQEADIATEKVFQWKLSHLSGEALDDGVSIRYQITVDGNVEVIGLEVPDAHHDVLEVVPPLPLPQRSHPMDDVDAGGGALPARVLFGE